MTTATTQPITFDATKHAKRLYAGDYSAFDQPESIPGYKSWWQALPDTERNQLHEEFCQHESRARDARDARQLLDKRFSDLRAAGIPEKDIQLFMNGNVIETAAMQAAREHRTNARTVLVLLGPSGVGKTTAGSWLAAMAVDDILARRKVREGGWGPVSRRSCAKFITAAQLTRVSRYDDKAMRELERIGLLVIDDAGAEFSDSKNSFKSFFDGLFNVRYNGRLRTVITSNLTVDEFRARYGERIIDRIREAGRFIGLDGKSLR